MRPKLVAASIALALCAVPMAASAARAYVAGNTQVFAGPGNDYPVVAQLGRGVAVNVNGCLNDYSWCDVSLGANRGWVYGGELSAPYHNSRVTVVEYGPRLAFPVVTFALGNYWDHYYRGRSFYGERARWEQHWNEHRYANNNNRDHHGDRGRADDRRGHDDRGHNNDNRGANNDNRGPNNDYRSDRYHDQPASQAGVDRQH